MALPFEQVCCAASQHRVHVLVVMQHVQHVPWAFLSLSPDDQGSCVASHASMDSHLPMVKLPLPELFPSEFVNCPPVPPNPPPYHPNQADAVPASTRKISIENPRIVKQPQKSSAVYDKQNFHLTMCVQELCVTIMSPEKQVMIIHLVLHSLTAAKPCAA